MSDAALIRATRYSAVCGHSARKFARDEVIPSIGTLLGEFVFFQSGLVRGFDPGPTISPCGRLCYARFEAWIVVENIVKFQTLRLDRQYPTARPQVRLRLCLFTEVDRPFLLQRRNACN